MAKRMTARTLAGGRVDLGTIVTQKLKTFVWWVDNQMKCGFLMNQATIDKHLRKELAEHEPTIKDIGKLDPDDFDTYKDAFLIF